MSGTRIMIVDDEQRMRKLVRDYMIREGYSVLEASNGRDAMKLFDSEGNIALIILDVMMPEMDGWQVCAEIRKTSKVPIIMLTARGDEKDELRGFELGVDEYVTKPFSPRTLAARVNAILRRTLGTAAEKHLEAGGIEMDKAAHIVKIDGEPIELSYKEFELLHYLMINAGIVMKRAILMDKIWGIDYEGESRTLDAHIKSLRKKLGEAGSYIKTVRNVGYILS